MVIHKFSKEMTQGVRLLFLMFIVIQSYGCKPFELYGKYKATYGYHLNHKILSFSENQIFIDSTLDAINQVGKGTYQLTRNQLILIYQGEFDNSSYEIISSNEIGEKDSIYLVLRDTKARHNKQSTIMLIYDSDFNVLKDTVFTNRLRIGFDINEFATAPVYVSVGYGQWFFSFNISIDELLGSETIIEYDLNPLDRDWFAFRPQVVTYDLIRKRREYFIARNSEGRTIKFEKID